ncbi:MAG: hypothetical protein J5497_01325 [Selenomonadaceae bacterium]|nr:hypothetical protein [Selenomonadaceae bacterium]
MNDYENFPYVSLCRVKPIYQNKAPQLERIADFYDDEFHLKYQPDSPPRNTLYDSEYNGFSEGYFGVWKWCTLPNVKAGGLNFVKSKFYPEMMPPEIFFLPNCYTKENLKNALVDGVKIPPDVDKFIFALIHGTNSYTGVICTSSYFSMKENFCQLKSDIYKLTCIEFNDEDYIRVSGRIFFKKINLADETTYFFLLKTPQEIIKEKVLAQVKWSKFKTEITKREFQLVKPFLRSLPNESFIEEIATACGYSVEKAKEDLDSFIKRAHDYLCAEDLSDEVLVDILESHPNFSERIQRHVSETWHKENEEKISAANEELKRLKDLLQEREEKLLETQLQLEEISNQIEQKEKLAVEVEKNLARRMETARQNIVDFICEMTFNQISCGVLQRSFAPVKKSFRSGEIIANAVPEDDLNLQELVGALDSSLGVEGASNDVILSFATYLLAAYFNKILLLLVGPNARDFADVFSVSLNGKTAAILDCGCVNSLDDLQICADSDDEVIIALNPFAPNFIAYLPELVHLKNKFIFAVHPFAEDLLIEPRSLYNYFLPVFTELISDRLASRNFVDFYPSEECKKSFCERYRYNPDEIPISAQERMSKLLKDTRKILKENFAERNAVSEYTVLFSKFPLAYVTDNAERFLDEFNGSEQTAEKIRRFMEK